MCFWHFNYQCHFQSSYQQLVHLVITPYQLIPLTSNFGKLPQLPVTGSLPLTKLLGMIRSGHHPAYGSTARLRRWLSPLGVLHPSPWRARPSRNICTRSPAISCSWFTSGQWPPAIYGTIENGYQHRSPMKNGIVLLPIVSSSTVSVPN